MPNEVQIQVPGYYDCQVELEWESYTGGGSVWVTRTRGGVTETVWPPFQDMWTAPTGRRFVDNVPALDCRPGDVLQLWVDPVAGSAQTLKRVVFVPRLLDRLRPELAVPSVVPDVDVAGGTFQSFGSSSYDQPLPDCQADDLLVMILSHGAGSAITTPDGWSVLDSDTQSGGRITILTRTADGSEGDTQTVSMGASGGQSGVTIRFRGSPETPSVDLQYAGTSNPRSFPTGTPLHGNGDYWVVPFSTGFEAGSPSVLPDGYPEIAYPTTPNPTAWERVWVGAAYEAVTGSVSVDPISWSNDGWNQVWTGVLLVKGG